jgi:uncharacterized protein YjiS (DUF1127 family)
MTRDIRMSIDAYRCATWYLEERIAKLKDKEDYSLEKEHCERVLHWINRRRNRMELLQDILHELSAIEISVRQIKNKIDRDMSSNAVDFCDRNIKFIETHLENIKNKVEGLKGGN